MATFRYRLTSDSKSLQSTYRAIAFNNDTTIVPSGSLLTGGQNTATSTVRRWRQGGRFLDAILVRLNVYRSRVTKCGTYRAHVKSVLRTDTNANNVTASASRARAAVPAFGAGARSSSVGMAVGIAGPLIVVGERIGGEFATTTFMSAR